jgi:CheY-like chemotaxis protein/anti-sigma regulatory factor (Ser/Thr protein kinase)
LETVIKAAERGGKMVKSLLSFARQSPAEALELDLNAIIREEAHLLERTTLSRVRLKLDLEPDLRPVRGDGSALTHAFMNLCVNAVDAMPENGTLTLRTRNAEEGWVEVVVEDTGSGMTPEILTKAMDPFFTTKGQGKGTGLGLSMVYSTMKAHQGHMELQSELGQGTRVRLRFPTCEPEAPLAAPTPRQSVEPSKHSLDVLLVDDDELIQFSIQAMLEELGHRPVVASNGEEALMMLEGGYCPEVVILDMNMPGLGGAGTLPRLRDLCPQVPILLATGRSDQSALDLVARYPNTNLMPKPFGLVELQRQLEPFKRNGA